MRLRLAFAAVVGAATLIPAAPAGAAVSAQVAETGWWSQRPGATAKDGDGFEAAAALGSEQSVAALRIVVSGGEVTTATLTLEESGGVGQDTAVLKVCPTTSKWAKANPGPYAEAPKANCGQSAELTRSSDGGTWTADIGILLGGAETSLVVVPDTAGPSGLPVGPGYQVDFSKATVEAAGGEAAGGLGTPVPESSDPSDVGDLDGDGAGAPSDNGGATDPAAPPESSDPAFDSSTPAPEEAPGEAPSTDVAVDTDVAEDGGSETDESVGAVESFASGPVASDGGGGKPWARLVFLVPLCALVGAGVAYGRPWLREHDFGRFLPG